jgi:UrcA family protein
MRKLFFASLITAALVSPAAAATVTAPSESIDVRYQDLDLSTESGQKALRRRIEKAAEAICGEAKSRDIGVRMKVHACHTKTVASAETKYQEVVAAATSGKIQVAAVK